MQNLLNDSAELRRMIEAVVREVVAEETRSCFKVYKATVVSKPQGSYCAVRLIGEDTVLSLPYSSAVSDVAAGDAVLVAVVYGSMRNAVVWQKTSFK